VRGRTKKSPAKKPRRQAPAQPSQLVRNIEQKVRDGLGAAVRSRREEIGMTQEELARAAFISRSYVSEVERGRENISIERVALIAYALNCHITDLLKDV
jgi:ribosome-binding protein aMBF1 (putative translation factor)